MPSTARVMTSKTERTLELARARKRRYQAAHPEVGREYLRRWRAAHPDYFRIYSTQWRAANPEQARGYVRKWSAANREVKRKINRAWATANPQKVAAYFKRYRAKNVERVLERTRQWKQANLDKVREYVRTRRARLRGNGIEPVSEARIIARDGMVCHLCSLPVSKKEFSLDHVVPISKGGRHAESNLRVAHVLCNARRGNRSLCVAN